jgi:hypothetical protein
MMETPLIPGDAWLLERLNAHPHLRGRIESLVQVIEGAEGDLRKADEAERRVIEEVRRLGRRCWRAPSPRAWAARAGSML